MSGEDSGEKQFEASHKRLEDLRKQGRIPRSADLQAVVALAGFMLALVSLGPWAVQSAGSALARMIGAADRLGDLQGGASLPAVWGLAGRAVLAVAPFVLLPGGAVLAYLLASRGLLLTTENLQPKLSRISPFGNFARKFGPSGLIEFVKNTMKMLLVAGVLGWFLGRHLQTLLHMIYLDPGPGGVLLMAMARDLLWLFLLVTLAMAVPDLILQRLRHARDARMTRQEMIEEHKDSEGDPHFRQHRRQKGQEIAMNRMMQDVETADVVVVNPTHYAVALKWDRGSRRAPVCVAKGVDGVAARIRTAAHAAGVPIHRDPPTARALFAALDLGQEVGRDHYKAVAAAIRFAEAMRRKARQRA